jgi:hypothetical protein
MAQPAIMTVGRNGYPFDDQKKANEAMPDAGSIELIPGMRQ